jgi:hypothetical protein
LRAARATRLPVRVHPGRDARAPTAAEPRGKARIELIAIQQRIVDRLKREIESSLGRLSPSVEIYYDEYFRELSSYERVASKHELVEACAAADIVYCGDYHTLRQSQQTAQKLIWELLLAGRDVTVAVEMVGTRHQHELDRYIAGQLTDEQFLAAIDYGNTWDFHWDPYRRLLGLCRREGLRVLALNSDPAESATRVLERDHHAAEVIVAATLARPGSVVFALTGDLHVARDHLPLIVDSMLQTRGESRRRVVVHQNAEPIYWKLAAEGREREADVVKLADDCWCVLSATPLVKLQSYLNWEQNHAELCAFTHPEWRCADGEPDYSEQMQELVSTIAGFLGIEEDGLDDFSIYTTGDLDFLDKLANDERFNAREIAEIKRQVRASESYFIPRANIIYLADLSTHRAAEEAAHFINTICGGFDGAKRTAEDAFYYRAVKEALGFFGSRIIDHKRYCMSFQDFRDFLVANRGRRLDAEGDAVREIGRLALKHREAEEGWLRTGRLVGVSHLCERPAPVANGLVHALGYILGDKLYNALVAGDVDKRFVRALFYDELPPESAKERYLALVKKLDAVEHRMPSEADRF